MAALLGAGAFAVHQLRFLLAFGGHAGSRLSAEGHAYLVPAAPLVVWLLLAVFAHALMCAARGVRARTPRTLRLWAGASASLVVVYCTQELIEGFFAAGHPGGLPGIFGTGGWLAIPLSLATGLAIALLMRGAASAPALLGSRRPWAPPRPSAPLEIAAPPLPFALRPFTPARVMPARGPPAPSV